MKYPIREIRNKFPALERQYNGKKVAYFDGPGGSQVVNTAIEAMTDYMINGTSNLGGEFITSIETTEHINEARQAIADLLGAKAGEVAFGQNMTSMTLQISRALSQEWTEGDNVVVTELDHRANVDPWMLAARDKKVEVNWIRMNTYTFELKVDNLEEIITEKTRVVAVVHASNGVGTVVDLEPIVKRAREVGALVAMDAVHSVPHILVDRDALDIDIILGSAYKFFGPHIGFAVIRKELFKSIKPYKVRPAKDMIPWNLETGTQNHEAIAGLKPVVDFIASIGEGDTRREKIISAYERLEKYEDYLAGILRDALGKMEQVRIYQSGGRKTPTIAFTIDGMENIEVTNQLAEQALFVGSGHFYADTIGELLDLNKSGGWIRVGIAPYNTEIEVSRLIIALENIIRTR